MQGAPFQGVSHGHAGVSQEPRAVPARGTARYGGKYVAWSPDGTKIIASDDDQIRLDGTIRELGYDPAEILVSSVPYPDEIILGGGVMEAEE